MSKKDEMLSDKINISNNALKGLKITYLEGEPLPTLLDELIESKKKHYEEIKNNKKFFSILLLNSISDEVEETAHEWWINHECFRDMEILDQFKDRHPTYPYIHLCRSALGTNIYIVCPYCKEQADVTAYGRW